MKIPKRLYVAVSSKGQMLGFDSNRAELVDRVNTYTSDFEILAYVPSSEAQARAKKAKTRTNRRK